MRRALLLVASIVVALLGWQGVAVGAQAALGEPAPDFTLTDTNGEAHTLSEYKGSVVVLEWSNHECPFVRRHYGNGKMQQLQALYAEHGGVIWFTIVSSAPGKQGYVTPEEANSIRSERGDRSTAMLLDSNGAVGRLYGAKTTPHMFIINSMGILVYAGAFDDKPSTDPEEPEAKINYVEQTLTELLKTGEVSISETKPYGCSVKY